MDNCRFEGVKDGPDVHQIQNDVQKELHERISYWKARKAREKAQELIRGSPEENYALLPAYCHVLTQVNPGTYTKLVIDEETDRFKSIFIAYGVSIRGFAFMRKVCINVVITSSRCVDMSSLLLSVLSHLCVCTSLCVYLSALLVAVFTCHRFCSLCSLCSLCVLVIAFMRKYVLMLSSLLDVVCTSHRFSSVRSLCYCCMYLFHGIK